MRTLTIQRLASGGVITNYHCVSRCGHCLYNCSPQRPGDYLEATLAKAVFSRIAELGCRSVHIGGGEPLLAPRKLMPVLAAARESKVGIDYVETNSAWFKDARQAADLLDNLRAAGVHTLLISISPFHNAHIPLARVKGVIAACRQAGMQAFPWVNAFFNELDRLDDRQTHDMAAFEALFGADYLQRIPDRYWIHLGGRALETFRPVFPQRPIEQLLADSPQSCARALGDTSHFHIDLYGNYIPGLCAGLAVSMDDLGRPLPAGKYPLLDRLAETGIRGLFDLASDTHGFRPGRRAYLNHCDLCTEIRHFLMQMDAQAFPELAPPGFYSEYAQR
jgi:hypothetical protein